MIEGLGIAIHILRGMNRKCVCLLSKSLSGVISKREREHELSSELFVRAVC